MLSILLAFSFCLTLASCLSISDDTQQPLNTDTDNDSLHRDDRKPAKIAVIGSGITGAVAAFYVYEGFRNRRSALDDPLPEITVFERNPIIGGRITQAFAYDDPDQPIDTCAQYFATTDRCISQSAQNVGLQIAGFQTPPDVGTGSWNGTNFIGFIEERGFRDPLSWSAFKTSKWYPRYGDLPRDFNGNASRISTMFDSLLPAILNQPGTPGLPGSGRRRGRVPSRFERNLTAVLEPIRQAVTAGIAGSCDPQLDDEKTCERYANFVADVLDPAANERFFTGAFESQVPPARLNALAVYRSYLGLRSNIVVAGGNLRLIERLLTLANAKVLVSTEVRGVQRSEAGDLQLTYRGPASDDNQTAGFDSVILAAPFQLANLTFFPRLNESLTSILAKNPMTYLDTFVTHFTSPSTLNATAFDHTLSTSTLNPQRILSSAPFTNDPPFISLRLVQRVVSPSAAREEYLYRLVSRSAPDLSLLPTWLNKVTGQEPQITWTDVQPLPLSTPAGYGAASLLEDVEIAPGVVYAGGGEQVLGIAEFGCKMGANAAELLIDRLVDETSGGV